MFSAGVAIAFRDSMRHGRSARRLIPALRFVTGPNQNSDLAALRACGDFLAFVKRIWRSQFFAGFTMPSALPVGADEFHGVVRLIWIRE